MQTPLKWLAATTLTSLFATTGLSGCQAPPSTLTETAQGGGGAVPVMVSAVSGSHSVTVDAAADAVSLAGYTDAGAVTARVELWRVDATHFPLDHARRALIGTATGRLGVGGVLGINQAGGVCWETATPDILPGDTIRVTLDTGASDETRVAFVSVDPPAIEGGKLTVRGNATDGFHHALPLDQLEIQLISRTGTFVTSGRRDVRVKSVGDSVGTIAYNPSPLAPGDFTVTFSGLKTADYPLAVAATARVTWLGKNPDTPNERTHFDIPELAAGAMVGCLPTKLNAITVTDHPVITPTNMGTPLTLSGVANGDVTRVSVSVNGGPPTEVLLQPMATQKAWTVVVPTDRIGAPAAGPFTAVASFQTPTGAPLDLSLPEQEQVIEQFVMPRAAGDNVLTASPAGGTFAEPQTIELAAQIPGSQIFFTRDGSTPTEQSARYTGPLVIWEAMAVKFIAKLPDGTITPVKTETYRFDAPFYMAANPLGGTYAIAQYVNLTTTRPATIYYTTDGSDPNPQALGTEAAPGPTRRYTGAPVLVSRTATLKFMGVDATNQRTPVTHEDYTIQDVLAPTVQALPHKAPPTVTLVGRNQLIRAFASEDASIYYTTDGTTPTTASTRYSGKGIAVTDAMVRQKPQYRQFGVPFKFLAVDLAGNASPIVSGQYLP